ncbi:hypothetical protein MMC29_007727, partial [Sticta canariensis]|nr:hypothetical protein [Sticta canariensis]
MASASQITMTSNPVIEARSLIPFSTLGNTVISDHTVRVVLYHSYSNPFAPVSTIDRTVIDGHTVKLIIEDLITSKPDATPIPTLTTIGRIAPELSPIITSTPTASKPDDTPFDINVSSNTISPTGSLLNPIATIGIILGIVAGLSIAALLIWLLLRRRRLRSHLRPTTTAPTRRLRRAAAASPPPPPAVPLVVIPRPVEPASENPWPRAESPTLQG